MCIKKKCKIIQYKRPYDVINICISLETGSFSFWKSKSPPVSVRHWTAHSQPCVGFSSQSAVLSKKQTERRSHQELLLFTDHILQSMLLMKQIREEPAAFNYSTTQFLKQRATFSHNFFLLSSLLCNMSQTGCVLCNGGTLRLLLCCNAIWVTHEQSAQPGHPYQQRLVAHSADTHWARWPQNRQRHAVSRHNFPTQFVIIRSWWWCLCARFQWDSGWAAPELMHGWKHQVFQPEQSQPRVTKWVTKPLLAWVRLKLNWKI